MVYRPTWYAIKGLRKEIKVMEGTLCDEKTYEKTFIGMRLIGFPIYVQMNGVTLRLYLRLK